MNEMAIDASKLDKFNVWRHLLESSRFASESNGKRISRLSQHFGALRRKQLLHFSTRWPTDRFFAPRRTFLKKLLLGAEKIRKIS